ncbi:MAG: hypothetical protein Q9M97_06030 [Candidatus Gracilibacteria bacterium]|nr:hypothetical protein [Candidatus Gracilibacteria bacterium]
MKNFESELILNLKNIDFHKSNIFENEIKNIINEIKSSGLKLGITNTNILLNKIKLLYINAENNDTNKFEKYFDSEVNNNELQNIRKKIKDIMKDEKSLI